MPISAAYQRCPQAVFLPPDMTKVPPGRRPGRGLFLWSLTPDVEPVSIDEAFLDISGTGRLWGTPRQAGQLIRQRVRDAVGLTASVGIAPNKMVAKIASDYGKPDGLVEVSVRGPAGLSLALEPWIGSGGWAPGPDQVLAQLGIRTVGELAALSGRPTGPAAGRAGPPIGGTGPGPGSAGGRCGGRGQIGQP